MDWLRELERMVKKAAKTVADLRRENSSLRAKVRRLEAQAKSAGEKGSAAAWRREREQIRERVDRLASQLEELLDE